MSKIAGQYRDGQPCSERIRDCADRMASQLYRAAVIGEFKRGKSSIINALLGTEVLPTSVLPMTAVITRVIYGEEKRIMIRYKNGSEEEATIEQLIDFATQYDEEKALRASRIKEILVSYPSVFCKNHIEIIDTPGMNDNEAMTAVTLGVLGNIDAAIMVISAQQPLSMSEQELILMMLSEQGIHHIVFVVTHIDAVSDEPEEQDRMIGFIRQRISHEMLEAAQKRFANNEELAEKSCRILEEPDIFGVSSVQAMHGFIHDNEKELKRSRFPQFKKELLTLLTAAQSTDTRLNTKDFLTELQKNLNVWYEHEQQLLQQEQAEIAAFQKRYSTYFAAGGNPLQYQMSAAQNRINTLGLNQFGNPGIRQEFIRKATVRQFRNNVGKYKNFMFQAADDMKAIFIKWLYTVKTDTNTDETVLNTLQQASLEAYDLFTSLNNVIRHTVEEEVQKLSEIFFQARPFYEASEEEQQIRTRLWDAVGAWHAGNKLPELGWTMSPLPSGEHYANTDLMPHIKTAIICSLEQYADDLKTYLQSWYALLQSLHKNLLAERGVIAYLEAMSRHKTASQTMLQFNHQKNCTHLEEIAGRFEKLQK